MKNFLLIVFATFLLCNTTQAQQFLNGSLEPANSTIIKCNNTPKSVYDAKMGNSVLTDSNGAAIFMGYKDTCDNTDDGLWYAGLIYLGSAANTPKGDRISLKLDMPMVIGKKYRFSFAVKASGSIPACTIYFGTMNDSIGATRGITDSIAAPTSTSAWTTVTDSFISVYNDQFMYFEAGTPTALGDGVTFVDHFRITNISDEVNSINNFSVNAYAYPNPFAGATTINIDEHATMPCNLVVTDVTGRIVLENTISERKTRLDMSNLAKGAYFVRIADKEHKTANLKLIAQ